MSKRLIVAGILLAMLANVSNAEEQQIYVGTYTGGASEGIYLLGFDSETGALTLKGLAVKTTDPSFVALHPNGKYLYAVNETGTGELSAFKIDPSTRRLELINGKASGGGAPCHLVIDKTGSHLLVANYSGGNVSVTQIKKDGSLGRRTSLIQHDGSSVNEQRQQEPHAHSINLDAANRFAVVADLGTDELVVYRFDEKAGTLKESSAARLSDGSGPRHFAFHPDGKWAYVINELLSTVSVFEFEANTGALHEIQTITTLPPDFEGRSFTAEVRVSADGRFVYGSNRGHDSIAVFRVGDDGRLSLVQIESIGGKAPRNFCLDPSGSFLLAAGKGSNNINVFAIDQRTGKLSRTAHSVEVPSPVCIRFAR